MQIQCVICSDLITSFAISDIIGLACGHIFHGLCIRTWLERSATCPQCRSKVSNTKQFKIYFTVAPEPEGQDIVTLVRNVDNLKYELKLKSTECSALSKQVVTYKTKADGLVKEVRKLETNIASVGEIRLQLSEQRKYATEKARELTQAKYIIQSLENELQQYQTLKSMVNNANKEIDLGVDIASLDSSQLTFLLNTFKKDISRLSKIDGDLKKALSKAESEKLSLIKKNQDLQEEVHLKDRVIESLKESITKVKEREIRLKKELNEASCGKLSDTKKSLDVSTVGVPPTPPPVLPSPKLDTNKTSSDGHSQLKENLNVPSSVSSSLLNTLPLSRPTFRITSDRFRSSNQLGTAKKFSSSADNLTYDGMGGHSKVDVFPSGLKPKPKNFFSKPALKKRKL